MTNESIGHLINTYKTCPQCGKTDALEVLNYDLMWHDGEVWCTRCEVKVREYDAG